jgi:hypothetical protein
VVQQNKSCSSADYCYQFQIAMSLHVTPSPPDWRAPQSATTKLSTQLQTHHILYDIDLLVQDMASTATKMTHTFFENGDDKTATLKLKSSYLDHLKALEQFHLKMQQSFKLLGIHNAALVYRSSKKSHINADNKRSRIFVPRGKRNNPTQNDLCHEFRRQNIKVVGPCRTSRCFCIYYSLHTLL